MHLTFNVNLHVNIVFTFTLKAHYEINNACYTSTINEYNTCLQYHKILMVGKTLKFFWVVNLKATLVVLHRLTTQSK